MGASIMLKKLLRNRKGTAEVIGSVMFIVILLFFFTNVYLWHDAATKQTNDLYVKKMNAGMEPSLTDGHYTLTAKGSNVVLSRIWIVTGNQHLYADLAGKNVHLIAGEETKITFTTTAYEDDDSLKVNWDESANTLTICYSGSIDKISYVNTLGIIV